jgi:acyl carrier protein
MENLESTVNEIIRRFLQEKESEIPLDAKLEEDLGMDSLGFVEMIMALEETYDLSISSEEGKRLITAQDVLEYMKRATQERAELHDPPRGKDQIV